jgi:hypothetical protein
MGSLLSSVFVASDGNPPNRIQLFCVYAVRVIDKMIICRELLYCILLCI